MNIIFKLSQNTITISEIKKEVEKENLNNTNVINLKELKFSIEYIKANFDLVSTFLNVTIIKNNITTAIINNLDLANISMDLINSWENINSVIFKPDKKIGFDIFLKLLDSKYLKKIDVYDMPYYLIERLDTNKDIKIKTRNKIASPTPFACINNLNSYSDIYYKKILVISNELTKDELEELKAFININNRLKVIRITEYSNEILTTILKELKENNKHNIVIQIYEKDNDLKVIFNSVNYIKKKEKNLLEHNKIKFKLTYSNEYKTNNFFKELNFKMFATLIGMIIVLSIIIVTFNYCQLKLDQKKVDNTMDTIQSIVNDNIITTTTSTSDNESTEETTTVIDSVYTADYSRVIQNLTALNSDTVGWITVNNTKIDYPVVQGKTNSYYLWRDFNKKKNSMGWIFMDYRNNAGSLDKNTIIYGHNVKEGIMFGTLNKIINDSSWNSKESNRYITFNTANKNMKWLIFSAYRIPTTDDYLQTTFSSDEEFMQFIELIKSRSKRNYNVEIKATDKILTLQTCSSNDTRNVVHAVLVSEE
jgi:sortase B